MWGGRFSSKTNSLIEEINASIKFDHHLAMHDINGSIAHVTMLSECSIIREGEAKKIVMGLEKIRSEITKNEFEYNCNCVT